MSELIERLRMIDTGLSIQATLLSAAPNPKVAADIKARIADLHDQRIEVLTMMEARR